jgi:hypothetical protein
MAAAVVNHDLAEIERRHAFEAGDIDSELVRVRAALVVGADAADGTEMMLGGRALKRYVPSLSAPRVISKPPIVPVTATAPRILQIEQVQRRAEASPSGSSAVN